MKYAKRLAHRIIDGQAFIVDPAAKVMHSLNPVGSLIWRLLRQNAGADSIAAAVAEEFDVSAADARKDVDAFLAELKSKRLVED